MSSPKVLSSSALAHSASLLQTKHEKSLGIKDIKHWSALDAALKTLDPEPGVDFFVMHHFESEIMQPIHSKSTQPLQLLDFDDDSSNGDVDYIIEDTYMSEQLPRLHGTPLVVSEPNSSPNLAKQFVDLSSSDHRPKVMKPPKVIRAKIAPDLDEAKNGVLDPLAIFSKGITHSGGKECLSSVIRKGPLHVPRQPATVHRGLALTKSSPELSPMSFKLLCANEMPSPIARIPLSGSPLQHPFRVVHKKTGPSGNVEGAVQIFKVDVSSRSFPHLGHPFGRNNMGIHSRNERKPVPPTPLPPLSQIEFETPELPPLGGGNVPQSWGQVKPMEAASQLITQPPRDYGFVIHLALNRQK